MSFATPANISITGAGNQTTGFNVLTSWNLHLSAAGTIRIRETSGSGTIVAEKVLAAAGEFVQSLAHPLRCRSGNFFVENSAGNVTGGVAGWHV